MQIHELNNYNGDLNSNAYLAVDNGTDTGKVSTTKLLESVNENVSDLGDFLNARIDNIIAGGDAPSEAEIIDARLGYDGAAYPSLGDAIRAQTSDLNSDFEDLADLSDIQKHLKWEHGGIDNATGATNNDGSLVRSRDVTYYKVSDFLSITNKSTSVLWIIFYTESGGAYTFHSSQSVSADGTYTFDVASVADDYFRLDIRGGLSEAAKVELLYSTDLVRTVNKLVNENVIDEIPQRENLFDKTTAIAGKYIKHTDGKEGSSESYYATEFIPVRKGVTYYTGGFYPTYSALYDEDKKFLNGNVISSSEFLGTFTPSEDGYFRGTIAAAAYLDAAYISPYHQYFVNYGNVDFTFASAKLSEESALNARGEISPNLFQGVCHLGSINTSTGAARFSYDKIVTSFIPIQGTLYYKLFNGKDGDVAIVHEYDSAKSYITYHSLTGKPVGFRVLDPNTRYIILTTLAASVNYVLPDPVEMSRNLLVTSNLEALGRLAANHNITGQESVRYDLFDKSIPFEKDYVKTAIESYRDGLRDNFYDFVLPMNTDLHTINSESYNMLTYMAESGMADICINLGDSIPDHYDTRAEAVTLLEAARLWNSSNNKKCELLVLRGNHDNNPVSDNDVTKMITDHLYYNIFQHRTKKGFYKVGLNYGFIDFEQSKIRLVVIDSGDIYDKDTGDPLTSGYNVMVQQDQFDWFCNIALDFEDKSDRADWSVITISHAQIERQLSGAFAAVIKAFMDGDSASGSASLDYGDYVNTLNYNVDYTSQGPMEYICHVNGHTHNDDINLIGNTNRYDIDIACENGTAYYFPPGTEVKDNTTRVPYSRTPGTIEEHLMDTLCLDKANRKIYMKRLGIGADREISY